MTPLETLTQWHDEFTGVRRDLHEHPEIGFTEVRTAGIVAQHLKSWGIETHEGVGRTGVVGVIRKGTSKRTIGLRADMDALPIVEESGVPWASRTPEVMHGCGHDGHTTMLLAAAKYLALVAAFDGTVVLIFQPAEEGLGGAQAMLADGLFRRFPCAAVYGMHNAPEAPEGTFFLREGPMMASAASFELRVFGKGSHGAYPEDGVDTVLTASTIVTALQSLVARNVPAQDQAVVSVTTFHAGNAFNVLPASATLTGTVRTYRTETMAFLERRMRSLAEGVAAGFGARVELDFTVLFAPLVNSAPGVAAMAAAAERLVGAARVDRQGPATMGSEDFAFLLEAVPGAFLWLGGGTGRETPRLHHPRYDFNDAVLPLGAALWVELVQRQLAAV